MSYTAARMQGNVRLAYSQRRHGLDDEGSMTGSLGAESQPTRPRSPDGDLRGIVEVPWVDGEDLELPEPFAPSPAVTGSTDMPDDAD